MAIAVREPLATLGTADVHRLTCLGNRRISTHTPNIMTLFQFGPNIDRRQKLAEQIW